ncbi:MAG: hypothetical protein HY918_05940 [Candidatus Doudnabacteria bacterium]|nr:hypothetical protein [Candidatus Doudnabacteria bacterium]
MSTVFFVDKDPGTAEQWQQSGHSGLFTALPFTPFTATTQTAKLLKELQPDFVVIASNLGTIRGMSVFYSLRVTHQFRGRLIMDGPHGKVTGARCTPDELRKLLDGSLASAPLPSSCVSVPPSKPAPVAPKLPESEIDFDGWARCTRTECGIWMNVNNKPDVYSCRVCYQKFQAIAKKTEVSKPPTAPAESPTATAFNGYGDIQCPKCSQVMMDMVLGNEEKVITCIHYRCHTTFIAKPYVASSANRN